MTIDQVIESGKHLIPNYWHEIYTMPPLVWLIGFGIIFIIALIAGIGIAKDETEMPYVAFFSMFILLTVMFSTVFVGMSGMIRSNTDQADNLVHWKSEIAYGYIKSLPEIQGEIVYIKIEPQIQYTDLFSIGWGYTSISAEKLQTLTVSYKRDGGIITKTSWYNASMTLTEKDIPYIAYHLLTQDLGNGISAGVYYPTVYLPNHYKFTEIK